LLDLIKEINYKINCEFAALGRGVGHPKKFTRDFKNIAKKQFEIIFARVTPKAPL
jgi:hypothetical protein